MSTDSLRFALGFSADDLAANRQGQLSEVQAYRLRVSRRRLSIFGALAVVVIAFIAALFIVQGGLLVIIGIGLTLCNALVVGLLLRHWLRLHADIRGGDCVALTGTLTRVIKPVSRRAYNYVIRVDETELPVSQETFEAFEHEREYTLYRAPFTGALLSAEPGTPDLHVPPTPEQ